MTLEEVVALAAWMTVLKRDGGIGNYSGAERERIRIARDERGVYP